MLLDLQRALYAEIIADAPLMAAVSGVFDHVPQGQAFPYVIIGAGETVAWDTDSSDGFEHTATVDVWDRSHRGRQVVKTIQDHLWRVLHRAELTVTGHDFVLCLGEFADAFLDADGATFHGVQRFRVVIEQE